ncbi:MAG TPA: VWA domain-containing protein [Isosphaeraceae bacterium]|nr:VWA domain-containing protein [Isosphaeraceae bacterium]
MNAHRGGRARHWAGWAPAQPKPIRLALPLVAAALVLVFGSRLAMADGGVPTDPEIARAIARGVDYLKSSQRDDGAWDEPAQRQHRLGVTALAGLALLENGGSRDDSSIEGARAVVEAMAPRSDQTYDLALAILFLARQQTERRGEADALIQALARRLAAGGRGGIWTYNVPRDDPESGGSRRRSQRRPARPGLPRQPVFPGSGDHSNTQFALLGIWAAGRHGFDPDAPLESIDDHFRASQLPDGRWGYQPGMSGSEAMSCAGLLGLAIAAARPSLAERQTARARGAALAKDPAFTAALRAVARDARAAGMHSDIYYLWSLERVCVALGLRSLDGFDWYAHGSRILLDRQRDDGGWPGDRWGRLPMSCLALLFLRKANLAFELDRVLHLTGLEGPADPGPNRGPTAPEPDDSADGAAPGQPLPESSSEPGTDDVRVIVTGANEQAFPKIAVQFEVKRPDGTFLRDAGRDDFRVTEDGRPVEVVEFQAPLSTEAIPTTIVLVVDRSGSMEQEDRIGGLKRAVASFLEKLPEGSRVAVVAFGSEVDPLCPFTTDRSRIRAAVDSLQPEGSTRFYDAVADALERLGAESGRRAILALTDGEDTDSRSANLDSAIAAARRLGLPVYTLGLGTEDEIESADLRRLAVQTRGQYYPARHADQLRVIYEQIAERIGSSYTLAYQTDRKLPDGTLRPIRIVYRRSQAAGETAVFIPGMVVPAGGWSPLFLFLLAVLGTLVILPGALARRQTHL